MKGFVKVRVPATTANCGAGFDVLGIACSLYNDVSVKLMKSEGIVIKVDGVGKDTIACDCTNIVVGAVNLLLNKVGLSGHYKGMSIELYNNIPVSRGLGSSAAAIVGGLKACNVWLGEPLSDDDLVALATELEGHPDNVAPAIFGGMVISVMEQGVPKCLRIEPPILPQMVACIPEFHLATKLARQALPKEVPFSDAVFNVSRTAMFVGAMVKGELRYLKSALEDKLHQPYRQKLIPGMQKAFDAAKNAGALGAVISGAGPTLMAFVMPDVNTEAIIQAMTQAFHEAKISSNCEVLSMDMDGARVVEC